MKSTKTRVRLDTGSPHVRAWIDVEVEVEGERVRLSMMGTINGPGRSERVGQITDTVLETWGHDARIGRLCDIWDRWHLNDLNAGTPAQMAVVRAQPDRGKRTPYDEMCRILEKAGVNPDGVYKYGWSWLYEPLPEGLLEELDQLCRDLNERPPIPRTDEGSHAENA